MQNSPAVSCWWRCSSLPVSASSATTPARKPTRAYTTSAGLPGALLPLVVALELLGSLTIVLGWQTRIAAFLLGGFSFLAGVFFHHQIGDQIQQIMLLKDIAITGAFALLAVHGVGPLSLDARSGQ